MEEKWRQLLDGRNQDLWQYVLKNVKLRINNNPEQSYITQFKEDKINILVNEANLDAASFTHELLHIFLKLKNILIATDLEQQIEKYPQLFYLFSDSLKEHMGNCLEHVKMLPLYLDRGFLREDFVGDYHDKIINEDQLEELQKNFLRKELYSRQAIDIYIGKYFSMKSTSNETDDYSAYFESFKNLDENLYLILNDFWQNWEELNIEEDPDYKPFLAQFLKSMNSWMSEKTII